MTRAREVLFIQGGGEGAHDAWDHKLVESLGRALGEHHQVRYPRMPDEADPSYARWSHAIRRELKALRQGAVVVGHSVGGTILVQVLAEQAPDVPLGAIILLAAPFVGEDGWPSEELVLANDLGARLPARVPVHLFHGSKDAIAPPAHVELYGRAIPQARVHQLVGRDHQLNKDLGDVAEVIKALGR